MRRTGPLMALVAHPDQFMNGKLLVRPLEIEEVFIPAAVAQGWIVLGRDSDIAYTAPLGDPQSNPVRHPFRDNWTDDDGA